VRKGVPLALVAGLFLILFAAAVVLVGIYVFLPSYLEESAAEGIQNRLGLESTPEFELEMGTLPEMLAGRFSGGRVTVEGAEFGGIRAERVVLDLDPLDLDLPASILQGAIASQKPLSGALRAEVSEREILRLTRAAAEVPVREVDLEKDRVVVGSEASVLGLAVPVSVQGSLDLRGGRLIFEPQRVSALGTPVPEAMGERLLAGADVSYPLRGLPRGARFTGVEVAEGHLVLSGEMERIPTSGPIG
jgi:hypothetical protein